MKENFLQNYRGSSGLPANVAMQIAHVGIIPALDSPKLGQGIEILDMPFHFHVGKEVTRAQFFARLQELNISIEMFEDAPDNIKFFEVELVADSECQSDPSTARTSYVN